MIALAGTGISGCASVERLRPDVEARTIPSRLDEIAYINTLREAITPTNEPGCYAGDARYFRPELSQGYPDHTAAQEGIGQSSDRASRGAGRSQAGACVSFKEAPEKPMIRRYLEAGFGLSDIYCQRFFIVASQAKLKRRFQRNVGTSVDALVGTILSLANSGETAIGIVNAGFGAVDSTFQNMDDSFLIAPDLENVRSLVHASQDEYRRVTLEGESMPTSYPAARATIERYAGICSFTSMQRLVNVSVAEQTHQLQEQTREDSAEQPTDTQGEQPRAAQPAAPTEGAPPAESRPRAATPAPPAPTPES